MKRTIKKRAEELSEKEERLKLALEDNEHKLKGKAKSVGKIALVTGLITLVGYWVYSSFFHKETAVEEKVSAPPSSTFTSRIGALLIPFVTSFLEELIQTKVLKKEQKGKG